MATARVARTGIQIYQGHEVGDEKKRQQVRVYRPEAEVFHPDSLHTFAHKPVTLHHPKDFVSAGNWKKHAVGHVDGEIMRDGDTVRIPMLIMDADAIRAVRDGVQELSVGYDAGLEWTEGITDSGEIYDAVQRQIRVNHIALTPMARGGPLLRLGDTTMDREVMTRSFLCDGITITLPEQDAQIVQRALRNAAQTVADAQAHLEPAQELSTRLTTDNQTLAGKIAALEQQLRDATVTDADLDARVIERQALIAQARKRHGRHLQTRRQVPAVRSAARPCWPSSAKPRRRRMTDAAIEGAFEAITADVKDSEGLRELSQSLSRPSSAAAGSKDDAERAWEERGKILREAWKTNNGSSVAIGGRSN